MKLVFLLEEPSMKYFLDIILPRVLPEETEFLTIQHNGRRALEASIPIKLRAWNEPEDVRFVIIHDQDNKNCIELKKHLLTLCKNTKRPVLVRIACQELESWYLGDIAALSKAYNMKKLLELKSKSRFQNPDALPNPRELIKSLIPMHQQISGAKKIAPFMDLSNNNSHSFNTFITGIQKMVV